MTLEQLTHFLAAARHLNFSAAAEELYVHSTSIGRSVSAIEQEIGSPLFTRNKHITGLTETGLYLQKAGQTVLDSFHKMVRTAKNVPLGIAGRLVVRGQRHYLNMLSRAYRFFSETYPEVDLDVDIIQNENTSTAVDSLRRGEMDLALLFNRSFPEDMSGIRKMKVFSDTMDFIVPKGHRLAGRSSVSIEELSGEIGITAKYLKGTTYTLINNELLARGLEPILVLPKEYLPDKESGMFMRVSAGIGIAPIPRIAALRSGWDCVLVPVNDFNMSHDMYLLWSQDNPNPTLRLFLDVVHGMLEQGPYDDT